MKYANLTKNDKLFNIILRLIIFVTFIGTFLGTIAVIQVAVDGNMNHIGSQTINMLRMMCIGYYISLIGSAAIVVMSLLSKNCANTVCVIFRTIFALLIFVLEIAGIGIMNAFNTVTSIISDYGYGNILTMSRDDLDLSNSQLEAIDRIGEADESAIAVVLIGLMIGVVAYFIMSITSIVNLATLNNKIAKAQNPQQFAPNGMNFNQPQYNQYGQPVTYAQPQYQQNPQQFNPNMQQGMQNPQQYNPNMQQGNNNGNNNNNM